MGAARPCITLLWCLYQRNLAELAQLSYLVCLGLVMSSSLLLTSSSPWSSCWTSFSSEYLAFHLAAAAAAAAAASPPAYIWICREMESMASICMLPAAPPHILDHSHTYVGSPLPTRTQPLMTGSLTGPPFASNTSGESKARC